jgi:Ca2+-binding RTX toxin-like protein
MCRLNRLSWLGFLALILAGIVSAFAAANSVQPSGAADRTFPIAPNDLRPPQCSGITLTNLVVGSGPLDGTNQNDLILGSSGPDTIRGRQGNDCILGGGGDDDLRGDQGASDVCIGGPGTDTADNSCETTSEVP